MKKANLGELIDSLITCKVTLMVSGLSEKHTKEEYEKIECVEEQKEQLIKDINNN